ncbi:GTP-binding protein 10 homolog isoform X2 [Apis cerana]|uniref:GTP-binding protein 10 homolog isoform X2 n=1 Tax=Apis cerana TaxID=7461 RepID=UPI0007E2CEA3|nr:GTP-binding protein 10 homolog isoform X2 [Apis cerana]
MVILTRVLGYMTKLRNYTKKYNRQRLIDSLRIHVTGGTGGSGLPSYGGLGGPGGNVYLIPEKKLTLKNVKYKLNNMKLKAGKGSESSKKGLIGIPGEDLNISVPIGITVYDENHIKLGEINSKDTKLMIAKGGIGGCEQTGYCGLKVTTIKPQIGIIKYKDYRQISIADLPGLIEGAHINKGMGHKFLKHVERTKLLLFIVDIQGCQVSINHKHRSCLETILLLNKEIELYKPDLLDKPAMIIINKMDTKKADEIYNEIKPKLNNLSKFLPEFDKSIQPTKTLQFDDVLTTSLILKDANEIQKIKIKIRQIIDEYEEKIISLRNFNSNADNLCTKLKQQTEKYAPTFV